MKKLFIGTSIAVALVASSFLAVGSVGAGVDTATLTVTKTVVGTPPPGATFVVNVYCEFEEGDPETMDIEFGPSGGSEDVLFSDEALCTVTEVDNGGADSSTGPIEVLIDAPTSFEAEIVNTFDPEPTPTTPVVVAPLAFTG